MRHPSEARSLGPLVCLCWSACTLLQEFGDEASDPADIGETDLQKLPEFHGLVVGAPTWNTDCDTERSGTNWDGVLEDIKGESQLTLKCNICSYVFICSDSLVSHWMAVACWTVPCNKER